MIKAVKFVSIAVSDQDRALSFYTDKLGFRIATDQPMGESGRWIEVAIPGAETRLVLHHPADTPDTIGTTANVAFVSDDVFATHATLADRGVSFEVEPEKSDWGSYAIFTDPDGNRFVVSSR